MRNLLAMTAFLLIVGWCMSAAEAAVSTTGSMTQETTVQSDYSRNQRNSDSLLWFKEQDKITLSSNLAVDITQPGSYSGPLTSGTIAAGTGQISSYIVHFDPTDSGTTLRATGTMTFLGETVVGIIVKSNSLIASDSKVGHPSVSTWDTSSIRGPERSAVGGAGGWIILSADYSQVTISFIENAGIDEIRIITTPEPGTFLLLGVGLAGLGFVGHRRKRRRATAAR